MLTLKQEKFVQNLIKGMSQREAYKEAYNAKYKDEAIDSKASNLYNSDKVQVRYNELLKQLEDETIMSAKERMKWLTKVIKGDIKEIVAVQHTNCETGESEMIETEFPSQLKTKLAALDTLNKMDGQYVTKLEGSIGLSYEEALKKVSDTDEY